MVAAKSVQNTVLVYAQRKKRKETKEEKKE
jgi:hypothetical protein